MATESASPKKATSIKAAAEAVKASNDLKSIAHPPDTINLQNPPVDAAAIIADQIADKQLIYARNLATAAVHESEKERIEAERALELAKKQSSAPSPYHVPSPVLPPVPGLSLAQSNVASNIASILDKLPEGDRKKWLEENKDTVLSAISGGFPAVSPFQRPVSRNDGNGNGNGHSSSLSEIAQLIAVMSAEARANQEYLRQTQAQMQPPQQGDSEMKMLLKTLIEFLIKQQTNNATQSPAQNIQNEKIASLEQRVIEAERQAFELKQQQLIDQFNKQFEIINAKINGVSAQATQLANLRTVIDDANKAGIPLATETPEQVEIRRKWDFEEQKLMLERQKLQMQHEASLAEQQARQASLGLVGSLFEMGTAALKLRSDAKKIGTSAGSPNSNALYSSISSRVRG